MPLTSRSLSFRCDSERNFGVSFLGRQAWVATSLAEHKLLNRPSSIGRKYVEGDTVLILDENRAVLRGAEGGPYRNCHAI
jgi:hypothetical protein